MLSVTVSAKGWVVIPSPLRKKYKIRPGTTLNVVDYGGVISIVPIEKKENFWRGFLPKKPSLTKALLRERAEEKAREQR